MNVVIIVEKYPQISETFIIRQARFLYAEVVTIEYSYSTAKILNLRERPVILTEGRGFILMRIYKLYRKLLYRLLGKLRYKWNPLTTNKLHHYLRKQKPDVLLAQFGTVGINCLKPCQETDTPMVVHFHGFDASGLLEDKAYVERLQLMFKGAAHHVVVNNKMFEDLVQLGCPQDKLSVIPCGVPVEEFSSKIKENLDSFNFLAVGRLIPKKSPFDLVKAFELCADSCEKVLLKIIGGGILERKLHSYISTSRHSKRIVLMGSQPIDVVRKEMSEANVFVQHSVTADNGDTEGWPVAVAEAMASGLPVISTKHPGIVDQVVHGVTGFLVDEFDVVAMGKYMLELVNNPLKSRKLGMNGKIYISKNGDFKSKIKALEIVLLRACNHKVK